MKTPSFAAAVCCLLLPLSVQATLYDPATPAQPGDNTIVLWSFDGTVGESPAPNPSPDSADPDLDGANDGDISGGSSLQEGRPGFGTALSIGAARVATPFTPSLINDTQEVTMAAWIKPDVASGYIVAGASGFLRFSGGVLNAGFGTDQDWVEASGGQPASWYVGKWTHVAATFHKGTTSLYVNGTLVASAAKPGAMISASDANWTGQFNLGGAPWDPGDYSYAGLLDEVQLLNTAWVPVPTDTIVYWGFQGDALDSATPELDGSNDGTFAGGFSYQPGYSGQALSIGEARCTTTITSSLVTDTQEYTMAAWINPSSVPAGQFVYVCGAGSAFIRFNGAAGTLAAGVYVGGPNEGWLNAVGGNNSLWYVGKWTHVAASYHRGTLSLYVNGTLVASAAHPGASIGFGGTFVLGGAPWDADNYSYQGLIQDVRLANKAVAPAVAPGTIVYWDFQGDSLDSATPELDGPNNGAISGGNSYQPGRSGQALSIGEARVMTAFTTSLINTTQQVAMGVWIKPNVASGTIVGGAGGFLRFSGGVLNAGFKKADGNFVETSGGQPAAWYVGKWSYVATTFDRGTVSLWVNGDLVSSTTSAAGTGRLDLDSEPWMNQFVLGGAPWDPDDYSYNGLLEGAQLMNVVVAGPDIVIGNSGGNVVVNWFGSGLESATNLSTGPWTPVPSAASPLVVPVTEPKRFYRAVQTSP